MRRLPKGEFYKFNVFVKPSAEAKLVLIMPRRENDCCEETNVNMGNICKLLFCDFTFTDLSLARKKKQVFSALSFGKVIRFWASCCLLCRPVSASAKSKRTWPLRSALTGLSLGHNARIAPISFFVLYSPLCFTLFAICSQNAIEVHWTSSCSAHCPAERYRKPLAFFMQQSARKSTQNP